MRLGIDFGARVWYDGVAAESHIVALIEAVAYVEGGTMAVAQPTTVPGIVPVGGRLFCLLGRVQPRAVGTSPLSSKGCTKRYLRAA